MELQDELNKIFREVFDDEFIVVAPETTSNDVDGWDSLSHVNLIVTIETRFGIRFTQREVLSFKNVGDLSRCVQSKLVKQ